MLAITDFSQAMALNNYIEFNNQTLTFTLKQDPFYLNYYDLINSIPKEFKDYFNSLIELLIESLEKNNESVIENCWD